VGVHCTIVRSINHGSRALIIVSTHCILTGLSSLDCLDLRRYSRKDAPGTSEMAQELIIVLPLIMVTTVMDVGVHDYGTRTEP